MDLVRHSVAAWASACLFTCLFTACGGGGETAETAPSAVSAPQTVPLEGCVVDRHDQAHVAAVRVRGEDGRLLASGSSNAQGVFKLSVPTGQPLVVGLDVPGTDQLLALFTTDNNVSLGACFREGAAS